MPGTAQMTHADDEYVNKWRQDFDTYCSDAQECEDRRWTRKEFERMRDFVTWFEAKYFVQEDVACDATE